MASMPETQGPRDRTDALRSPDVATRREALQQIAAAGNPEAAGAVAALATDADDQIQLLALGTLVTLLMPAHLAGGEDAKAGGPGAARRVFEAAGEPARPVPASAFEPVARAMTDETPQVALEAGYVFAFLASSRQALVPDSAMATAQGAIETMIGSPDDEVRLPGIRVAGGVFRAPASGPPPAPSRLPEAFLDALMAAMNRPGPEEQAAAMDALGRARETRAREALEERFAFHREQGHTSLAVTALDALARLADPSTTEMVRTLATDRWARNGDPYLAVLFARERLLKDGSTATLKQAAQNRLFATRARAYLAELGVTP
jgi:hypothetical protein